MADAHHVTPVAIGFCSSCCVPLGVQSAVLTEIEGESMLFCSEMCIARYHPHSVFHW